MVKRSTGKKKAKPKLPAIKCKGCGVLFTPKTHKEKYHSAECREEYYGRAYYHGEEVEKQCPNCGDVFKTTKPGVQDYCTPECRDEAAQKRRDNIITDVQVARKLFFTDKYRQMALDHFKCTYCGRGVPDGIKLDVIEDKDKKYVTVCNECQEGMNAKATT